MPESTTRTIREQLLKMTLNQMHDLAFRICMPDPPASSRKAAWADALCAVLPDAVDVMRRCVSYADIQAIHGLLATWKRMGLNAEPSTGLPLVPPGLAREDLVLGDALGDFEDLCMIWRDKQGWHLRPELVRVVRMNKADLAAYEQTDRIFDLISGMLNLYGILLPEKVSELLAPVSEIRLGEDLLTSIYLPRAGLRGMLLDEEKHLYLVARDCADPPAMLAAIRDPELAALDLARYTPEDAWWARRNGFPRCAPQMQAFMRTLQLRGVMTDDLDGFLLDTALFMQDGDVGSAYKSIACLFPTEPNAVEHKRILALLGQVPMWRFKGHTASEFFRPLGRVPEAEPDSLCPCGSGRKYKNCHGRMN